MFLCAGLVITSTVDALCPSLPCSTDADCVKAYNPPPGSACNCAALFPGQRTCVCPCHPVMPTGRTGLPPEQYP